MVSSAPLPARRAWGLAAWLRPTSRPEAPGVASSLSSPGPGPERGAPGVPLRGRQALSDSQGISPRRGSQRVTCGY